MRIGAHRCEADAAVAHDRRGHPVPARRRHALVPRGLPVVVRVDVDEPRGDEQAVGIHLLRATAGDRSHRGDGPTVHRHVGEARLAAPPVGHQPAPDHEIVHCLRHALPLTLPGEPGRQSVAETVCLPQQDGTAPPGFGLSGQRERAVGGQVAGAADALLDAEQRPVSRRRTALPQARLPSAVRQARMARSGSPSRSKVTVYVSTRTAPLASGSTAQRGSASTAGCTLFQAKRPRAAVRRRARRVDPEGVLGGVPAQTADQRRTPGCAPQRADGACNAVRGVVVARPSAEGEPAGQCQRPLGVVHGEAELVRRHLHHDGEAGVEVDEGDVVDAQPGLLRVRRRRRGGWRGSGAARGARR